MAEIVLAVPLAVIGLAAVALGVMALPWAIEANAPRSAAVVPFAVAVACFGLVALLIFGG